MTKQALKAVDSSQSLVDLAGESYRIAQALVESGGELTPEIEAAFDMNQLEVKAKVDTYVYIDERLEVEAKVWADKARVFAAIGRGFTKAQENLRNRIHVAMETMGTKEVLGNEYRWTMKRCQKRLVIDNPEMIPAELQTVETVVSNDKARIKHALEAGLEVPGARLEGGTSITHYPNSK